MIHMLVVDDKLELRTLIRLAFHNRTDYAIAEAEDGEQALSSIARQRPDIVLLDVMMPGPLDGLDVLDRIRSNPEHAGMKVFILSGRGQDSDRAAAMAKGADVYFVKPFSIIALMNAIDQVFDTRASHAITHDRGGVA